MKPMWRYQECEVIDTAYNSEAASCTNGVVNLVVGGPVRLPTKRPLEFPSRSKAAEMTVTTSSCFADFQIHGTQTSLRRCVVRLEPQWHGNRKSSPYAKQNRETRKSRGAHTFLACELLAKWTSQNDLPILQKFKSYIQWRNWQGGKGASRPPQQAKCKNWAPSSWHFHIYRNFRTIRRTENSLVFS